MNDEELRTRLRNVLGRSGKTMLEKALAAAREEGRRAAFKEAADRLGSAARLKLGGDILSTLEEGFRTASVSAPRGKVEAHEVGSDVCVHEDCECGV